MKNENTVVRLADFASSDDRRCIVELWQNVFGDDKEYITTFIDDCHNKKCLAVVGDNNKFLSMLFLIDCTLNGDKGAYVYAVATHKDYRKLGLMAILLEKSSKMLYDFLCLVPAEDYLFDVYAKFGYVPCVYGLNCNDLDILKDFSNADYESYFNFRKKYLPNNYIEINDTRYIYNENLSVGGSFLINGNRCATVRYNRFSECLPCKESDKPIGMILINNKREMKKCYISFVLD